MPSRLNSRTLLSLCTGLLVTGLLGVEASPFRSLFDGKTLEGWNAPDMGYWRVEDGAITAESTEEKPCTKNQFLVWQHGEVDDFELTLKFRVFGGPTANSGIQIRSGILPDGHVVGYQADIDRGQRWLGSLYDEHMPRKMLAARGNRASFSAEGVRKDEPIEGFALPADFNPENWNEYRIVAQGSRIRLSINGVLTADVLDQDPRERDYSGLLALQLHSGPAMKVQFKDIRMKRLPLAEGRRKVVFLAGKPSHRPGDHEHNAGCLLLSKALKETSSTMVQTAVYLNMGWPEDPTAFDEANAVVVYSDGGARHPLMERLKEMEAMHQAGVSLGTIHYAVEVPVGEPGDHFLRWIGGYFETYYSVNPHWDGDFKELPTHPVTRGVKPFRINDEWYYHMRFRPDMKGVTPILSAVPPDETRTSRWGHHHGGNEHVKARMGMKEVVMWLAENDNGTRGFGFTGGHFHKNWGHPDHRKVVLNAILWLAGAEVPAQGVEAMVTEEDLTKNLDPKPQPKR